MTVSGYSRQRVLLHWLSAAVILWTLLSGFFVAGFEVPAHMKESVAFFNVGLQPPGAATDVFAAVRQVYNRAI